MTPKVDLVLRGNWIDNVSMPVNKVYAILCCLQYLLDAVDEGNDMRSELKGLLKAYPQVDVGAMGFPSGWDEEPLWKSTSDEGVASDEGETQEEVGTSDEVASQETDAADGESSEAVLASSTEVASAEESGGKVSDKE